MKKEKVVVAMSGGVDSSLVAALLVQEGYAVIGLTMQLWQEDTASDMVVSDARKVAEHLGIPFHAVDFRDLFHEKVVRAFIDEYKRARTPNPCVVCNRKIKFDALLAKARELGADKIATGHYAQIEQGEDGKYQLKKGLDPKKDQSYFLYHLDQDILSSVIFPLGRMEKTETRELAEKLGLHVAKKKESQEICFIPDNDYKSFLERHCPKAFREGEIVDREGTVRGKHKGLPCYTIGQRKGLGIAAPQPLYVIGMDQKKNSLLVGANSDLFATELIAEQVRYVSGEIPTEPYRAEVKIRYAATPAEAVITPLEHRKVHIKFNDPQRAITPGQSVVFYDGDSVLGGAIIQRRV